MGETRELGAIKKELETLMGNYGFISKLVPKIDEFCDIYRMLQVQLREGDELRINIRAEQYGSNNNMFVIPVFYIDLVPQEGTIRTVLNFSCKDRCTPLKDFLLYSNKMTWQEGKKP